MKSNKCRSDLVDDGNGLLQKILYATWLSYAVAQLAICFMRYFVV